MRNFYISSKDGASGICNYSSDFYERALKGKGYVFMDSIHSISEILSAVSSKDNVHIEIAIAQKKEIEILFLMLKANYRHVSVTLHDAPLIKYPFYEFKNPFLNSLSKFYDKYFTGFRLVIPYIKKLKAIYVLSQKELNVVKKTYRVENVYLLGIPIDHTEIKPEKSLN